MPSSFDKLLFRHMLLLQPGIDDGFAVGDLMTGARMDHHLLGGLVHGQELAQRCE